MVYESANIKVWPYQVIRIGLFEETNDQHIFLKDFIINYILNFMYRNPSMKNPSMNNSSMKILPHEKYIIITKQKWKYYDFAREINCTCELTCVCACMCSCNHTRLREKYAIS